MPRLVSYLTEIAFEDIVADQLVKTTDAVAHIYLIQGYDFASRDIGSPSDPYLIVRCDDQIDNDRDNYITDEANPIFNKRLDFQVTFPGAAPIVIEAYDYDTLFGDDLIGKTSIDLDDRFFTPAWQSLDEKPIEQRELKVPSSKLSQGILECWVDIDPVSKASDVGKVWTINTEPTKEFEVRLSIFGCKNVPMTDAEGTTDVYIRTQINNQNILETDTHYRNQDGKPSYNYRLLHQVKTPQDDKFTLKLTAWDRDLLKSNDLICGWELDITDLVDDCKLTG